MLVICGPGISVRLPLGGPVSSRSVAGSNSMNSASVSSRCFSVKRVFQSRIIFVFRRASPITAVLSLV